MNFCWNTEGKLKRKIKRSVCITKRAFMFKYYPLCLILNSAYYAINCVGIFDTGLVVWLIFIASIYVTKCMKHTTNHVKHGAARGSGGMHSRKFLKNGDSKIESGVFSDYNYVGVTGCYIWL